MNIWFQATELRAGLRWRSCMIRAGWRPSECPTTHQHTWKSWCRPAESPLQCYRYHTQLYKNNFVHYENSWCRECLYIYIFFLQVEFHPRLCQTELRSVCDKYTVCFQAYSSLGKGELVTEPSVTEVAKNCARTPAQVNTYTDYFNSNSPILGSNKSFLKTFIHFQVLLRWAVQQRVPVLPKSSNPDRITENAELFDFTLSDADMDRLSALDCGHKYCWDPSEVAW